MQDEKENISYSQKQMGQQNCQEETTNSENPLKARTNLQGVKISVENFNANRQGLSRQKQKMTLKVGETFGQSKRTAFIVIMSNFEFSSAC